MNILVAGDSFKGSLSSKEFTYTTARVLQENGINAKALPLSDGGEGALEVLTDILGGEIVEVTVMDSIITESGLLYVFVVSAVVPAETLIVIAVFNHKLDFPVSHFNDAFIVVTESCFNVFECRYSTPAVMITFTPE
jgi:hypothetical protein